jgi:nucleotide-binding universal stress UspA family protein
MQFKKILVPYDGSKSSENALEQAISLATNLSGDTELVLLNVVQEIPMPTHVFEFRARSRITGEEITAAEMAKELYHELKEAATKMLEGRKAKIEGLRVRTKAVMGHPVDKIIELADEEKADMIVIGGVGLGGLARIKALGSVSRGVAERAKCPVLIVH